MIGFRLWQIAGWTMLHYFWVGAALGAVALLARHRLRSSAAGVRYLVALGSLLLLSVTPAVIAVVVTESMAPLPRTATLPARHATRPEGVRHEEMQPTVAATATPAPSTASNLPFEGPPTRSSEQLLAALNLAAMCLPWFWVCGAPLSFALTTAGLLGAERLRRQSRPLEDARITELCRQLATSLKISYRVSVAVCDRIAAPILVGVLRPMILLPAAALAGWDAQQLEMVLLHELAHVRRYDNLVNLLQRFVEAVLFFQPMVWIISGWVRQEREHCCDELVVARTRQPHAYAEMLVTLAETLSHNPPRSSPPHDVGWAKRSAVPPAYPQAVSSMAERPLVARVRRILKKEEQAMQVSRKSVGLVCVGLLTLVTMIGGYCCLPTRAEDSSVGTNKTAADTKDSDAPNDPSRKPSAEKPAAEKKSAEALTYTGQVTDKLTGKPIAAATVVVRRMVVAPYEQRVLEEPKYTTDAEGKYTFTIPPQQAAQSHLYIELEVSHPDYTTRKDGYGFSMIHRNEQLGQRPFFEHFELYRADQIFGAVVTPDGKPAAGVKVLGFTMPNRNDINSHSFPTVMTDAQGGFRLNLAKGCNAVFWLLPKDYALSTHVIGEKRGDMGRLVLGTGTVIKGRVVDEHDQPVAGVWVNALIIDGPARATLGQMADVLNRSALTDEAGMFTLGPLPAGDYLVVVGERPEDWLHDRQASRPLSNVFDRRRLKLTPREATVSLKIRAIPQVVIDGQFYDGRGEPRSGHQPYLLGYIDDKELGDQNSYVTYGAIDENGQFIIRAPKGLKEANLHLSTTEHCSLRVRMAKDAPLSNPFGSIELGVLEHDIRGIEVIRYDAPILLVKPAAEDGSLLREAKVNIEYAEGRGPWKGKGRFVEGKDVSYEKQEDGRRRTSQLLPDEEFTVTVEAEGYEPKSEKLKLPEGAVKELEVRPKPAAPKTNDASGKTSAEEPVAGASSGDDEGEEQALEDFKRRYALAEGEVCKRVAPPFLPGRLIYYRQSSPGQAESMPKGPDAMCFRWQEGKLVNWSMTFGEKDLLGVLQYLADIYPQEIEGDEALVRSKVQGDWIVRKGAPKAEIVSAIEKILYRQCGLHVTLKLRDVERKLTVATGAFHLRPIKGPGQPTGIAVYLYDDALEAHGGSSGDIEKFARSLGAFVNRRILSDVTNAPKDGLCWYYNGSMPNPLATNLKPRDDLSVLKHVTEQTGLTFNEESKTVPVLFVERSK